MQDLNPIIETLDQPIVFKRIDVDSIVIPMWSTPKHSINKAFNDGELHAVNHFYGEEADPDWPYGVKSWTVNPYTENRPDSFYSWVAGFCHKWADLNRLPEAE